VLASTAQERPCLSGEAMPLLQETTSLKFPLSWISLDTKSMILVIEKSDRVDMKKFSDAKAPLGQIKFKLQIKADQIPEYVVFFTEIGNIIKEHANFTEKVEMVDAQGEALDPVQASTF